MRDGINGMRAIRIRRVFRELQQGLDTLAAADDREETLKLIAEIRSELMEQAARLRKSRRAEAAG